MFEYESRMYVAITNTQLIDNKYNAIDLHTGQLVFIEVIDHKFEREYGII